MSNIIGGAGRPLNWNPDRYTLALTNSPTNNSPVLEQWVSQSGKISFFAWPSEIDGFVDREIVAVWMPKGIKDRSNQSNHGTDLQGAERLGDKEQHSDRT